MVAGAVVGAVTGAAAAVAKEPTAVSVVPPRGRIRLAGGMPGGPGTREVLGELASGAAVGAVSGVAKAGSAAREAQVHQQKESEELIRIRPIRAEPRSARSNPEGRTGI